MSNQEKTDIDSISNKLLLSVFILFVVLSSIALFMYLLSDSVKQTITCV